MGIAREERVVLREQHLVEHLCEPSRPSEPRPAPPVRLEDLLELRPDTQAGVERRRGRRRHIRDVRAPQRRPLRLGQREEVAAVDADAAARDHRAAARVPEQRETHGRLAGARLANKAEHFTRVDRERDVVDDVVAAALDLDAQMLDLDGRAHPSIAPRSMPAEARESPSPIMLVPIVKSAIATTGMTTPHGWIVKACRFSLIISPQSALGGWSPKPRKLRPAISPIEYVRRRLASTSRVLVMFGRTSLMRILARGAPIASAAWTKSRSTTSSEAPRVTRATRGIVVSPTTSTSSQSFGPIVATTTSARTIDGKARMTSIVRMSTSSRIERA